MPEFRYRAVDRQGREVDGSVQAADANSAVQTLSVQGLSVRNIEQGPLAFRPPPPLVASPPTSARQEKSTPQTINPLSQPTKPDIATRRTAASNNGELFFMFAQLANLFRGGIAPADALATMSHRNHNRKYTEPLLHMASLATEGRAFSDALEVYTDLFPPGVVGAVRAGEKGGYLAEACGVISDQCKETHKLQRLFWWVGIAVVLLAVTLAVAFAGAVGIDRAISSINDPSDPDNTMTKGLMDALIGPVGWSLGGFFVFYVFIKLSLRNTKRRPQRHNVALKFPVVGKRARAENLALFSWHLNQLGNAGLSPFNSWTLAANAVPNIAYSKKLLETGTGMNESTRFSTLFYRSDLFPHEIAAVLETGEMTGNIATSLESAMDYSRSDQRTADMTLKAKAGCWMVLMIGGGGLIAFLILYGTYLRSALKILE